MSIFCAFSQTPPRVFVRLSSKLGKMCYMNLQKNVGSRNFEFLSQSIFTWGQTLLKSKKSKTRYFFAIQFSPAFYLVRIRTQLFYIFNWNSKVLIFSHTSPRVFVRLSSKLGEMRYMNLQKNLGSRNFEFLTESIFSWGQTLLKSTCQK